MRKQTNKQTKDTNCEINLIAQSSLNQGLSKPDSIPGSGKCPGEENGYHSSILAWRIPWTEEPGGL